MILIPDYLVHQENFCSAVLSKMTGKLKGIPSLNTNPLSNNFCIKMNQLGEDVICNKCYSVGMLKKYRQNCIPKFNRNSVLFSNYDLSYNDLPEFDKKINFIRFHSHGELYNFLHLQNYIKLCRKNPHIIFCLYTKRIDLLRFLDPASKPENLVIVYSNPKIDKPIQKRSLKVIDKIFNVVTEDGAYKDRINCAGRCIDCLKCYDKTQEKIIFERLK